MSVEFRISGPGGFVCSVQPGVCTTLAELQALVASTTGVHARGQRYYHGATELDHRMDLATLVPLGEQEHVDLLLLRRYTEVTPEDRAAHLQEIGNLNYTEVKEWVRDTPPDSDVLYDQEILLAVLRKNASALCFMPPEIQGDRDFILAAVRANGFALKCAPDQLKADRNLALAAVRQNGLSLSYVSPELKADRSLVLEAVRQNRFALRYAPEELQMHPELLRAIAAEAGAAHFVPKRARGSAWGSPDAGRMSRMAHKFLHYAKDCECLCGVIRSTTRSLLL